jgi:hypothetical protein
LESLEVLPGPTSNGLGNFFCSVDPNAFGFACSDGCPNVDPEVPLAKGLGVSFFLLPKMLVPVLLPPAEPKPPLLANEAKPPELGAPDAPLENGLAPGLLLLLAKLEKLDWPKAGALPLAPVDHGEVLMPSCEAWPNALGLPKVGALAAGAPPKELEPKAGCAAWVPVAGVDGAPHGEAF